MVMCQHSNVEYQHTHAPSWGSPGSPAPFSPVTAPVSTSDSTTAAPPSWLVVSRGALVALGGSTALLILDVSANKEQRQGVQTKRMGLGNHSPGSESFLLQ
jgi:hypothetical protein